MEKKETQLQQLKRDLLGLRDQYQLSDHLDAVASLTQMIRHLDREILALQDSLL